MRIKYDMNDNYFKCFNEAQGIFANKKALVKNPKKKIKGYIQTGFVFFIYTIILMLLWTYDIIIKGHSVFSNIMIIICIIILTMLVMYFANFIIMYRIEKKKKHSGELEINNKGITDFADEGTIITVKFDDIEFIATKKYTITLVLNTPFIIFINIDKKDKLLEEIQKYRKDILIIEQ